jgi:hypothetical protein
MKNIPTRKQINNFVSFLKEEHSWYKHLNKPYKFYIMFNFYEPNCEKYGGLYYFTDYYSPPYGFEKYTDLKLPGKDGILSLEIPAGIWRYSWIELDNKSIYKSDEKIYDLIDNLINHVFNKFRK